MFLSENNEHDSILSNEAKSIVIMTTERFEELLNKANYVGDLGSMSVIDNKKLTIEDLKPMSPEDRAEMERFMAMTVEEKKEYIEKMNR
jgi:hypothetical protein